MTVAGCTYGSLSKFSYPGRCPPSIWPDRFPDESALVLPLWGGGAARAAGGGGGGGGPPPHIEWRGSVSPFCHTPRIRMWWTWDLPLACLRRPGYRLQRAPVTLGQPGRRLRVPILRTCHGTFTLWTCIYLYVMSAECTMMNCSLI